MSIPKFWSLHYTHYDNFTVKIGRTWVVIWPQAAFITVRLAVLCIALIAAAGPT